MGMGRAQAKGFSAVSPQPRGKESFTASDQDKGASGQVMFPAEKPLLEGCVLGASNFPPLKEFLQEVLANQVFNISANQKSFLLSHHPAL